MTGFNDGFRWHVSILYLAMSVFLVHRLYHSRPRLDSCSHRHSVAAVLALIRRFIEVVLPGLK